MTLFDRTYLNYNSSTQKSINNFIKELETFLKKEKTTLYSIDRIEEDYAILENRNTLKTINIPLSNLPKNVSKNSILKYQNKKFVIDSKESKHIQNIIKNKIKNLY